MNTAIIPGAAAALALIFFILRALSARSRVLNKKPAAAPLTVPYTIPFLRSTFSFVFDGPNFFIRASRFCQGRWPLRVGLLGDEVYLVQGHKNISSIFSNPKLTVTRAYGVVLKYCCGMDQKAVDVYVSDTSGSRERPIPGSRIPSNRRVGYHTHENLFHGLLGSGLGHTIERFDAAIKSSLDNAVPTGPTWTYVDDLTEFFEDHLGAAILETLFGPLLLTESPGFHRTLWKYDRYIMSMAKRLPSWLIPEGYQLRDKVLSGIMKWHKRATELSARHSADVGEDDPYWGSAMMRERHKMLLGIDEQDLRSVASTDLALIWASITNVVPSTMTLCTHVYSDSSLVAELRSSLQDSTQPESGALHYNMDKISKKPLLLSLYAETLRYGVQIHIPRCSPQQPLEIGKGVIQPDKLILINTALAHTDEEVWNTRDGQYPLDTFWGRRFLVDPLDPQSGPLKPSSAAYEFMKEQMRDKNSSITGEQFTVQGLEGIWIPYGGGQNACPGRLLAKRIMLLTTAMMVTMFDVELLEPIPHFDSRRFGFGVRKPVTKVPFRIRRRC
ncbi:cholesterol 7-alpha-monooxygenase [Aspergillus awamori]|uniref:Cholesterol 7-alpha-monooxygenase n=1 Tax=Aspergillus awamori TaxID=105351 RepID=A0A401L9V7_ASPAW|nr:cholesterol 7-alpha-monooxygenase [Aspergillus awamori]GKZ57626.1 hypothetical protein AnigIFM49718_002949 [Aspergillus niger]GLA19672.1 hypothetical protein AnigIFM62618_007790 [Aspergillus niger]